MRSIIVAVLIFCCCSCRHITDDALIKNFNAHEETFDKLRQMGLAEIDFALISPQRVASSRSKPDGMPPQKYAEYMKLFKALKLDGGIIRSEQSVWFRAEAPSEFNGGVAKGYFYAAWEPSPVVSNLDLYVSPNPGPRPTAIFRALKPNWFLYKQFR